MGILDDIESKLVADSVGGGVTGWSIYKSYQPDSPDKVITIYESGGSVPDQTSGIGYSYPTFQVRGRGVEFGYSELRVKMDEVLSSLNNATISGYVYVFPDDSGVIPLGYDSANNRPMVSINFSTMKG